MECRLGKLKGFGSCLEGENCNYNLLQVAGMEVP